MFANAKYIIICMILGVLLKVQARRISTERPPFASDSDLYDISCLLEHWKSVPNCLPFFSLQDVEILPPSVCCFAFCSQQRRLLTALQLDGQRTELLSRVECHSSETDNAAPPRPADHHQRRGAAPAIRPEGTWPAAL